MEEPNNKQPQIPEPNKTPERVVRTYQGDLAKLGKGIEVPVETNSKPEKKTETPKPVTQKKEDLVTPPIKREEVTFAKQDLEKETRTHYVEEIQSTDSIDLNNTESFTKKDIDSIGAVPPKPKVPTPPPKPIQTPPPVRKESVIIEESSTPKQGFIASAIAWLLGGGGNAAPKAPRQVEKKLPYVAPKKLESVPIIPNVPIKKDAPESEPDPTPAPKLEDEVRHEVVLPQQETPTKPSNPLFAPPKEIKKEAPAVSLPLRQPQTEFKEAQPLSTYTSDARRGIKEQKDTPLSVLAKQQDSKKVPPKKQVAKKSSTPAIVAAVLFILLGGGAVIAAIFFLRTDTAPISTPQRAVTPVFAESRTNVTASAVPTIEDLKDLLVSVQAPVGNTLTHVTFSSTSTGTPEIIPFSNILLESNTVPGTLARSVYPQSMFGVFGETKEPVLVLAVTSFERSFKSLLSWEGEITSALAPIFGTLNTTQTGTTTPEFIQKFVDEEIETTDARILYDAAGNTHLIYGFVTPNILFITKTKQTFIDLTDRIVRE